MKNDKEDSLDDFRERLRAMPQNKYLSVFVTAKDLEKILGTTEKEDRPDFVSAMGQRVQPIIEYLKGQRVLSTEEVRERRKTNPFETYNGSFYDPLPTLGSLSARLTVRQTYLLSLEPFVALIDVTNEQRDRQRAKPC